MPQDPDDLLTRVMLLCLRGRFDAAALDAARELASEGDLDWTAWYDAVRAAALAPLLYRVLRGRAVVPARIEEQLRLAYLRCARDNALRFRDLSRAVRQLAAEGVQVILLKGAALAETVYGNIALRPMVDLDLLVHREDVPAALKVFTQLGYDTVDPETQAGAAVAFENQIALRKRGRVVTMIEIHWSLVDSPHYQHKLPMAWFWETAVPVETNEVSTLALGPEALVLHLCAHQALHHRSKGLLWLHDVAEVLYAYQDRLDWGQVLQRTQMWDLILPVQQVLERVARDWQAPIPGEVLRRLSALHPSPAEARVYAWMTAPARPVAQRFWADLASMPTWGDRLRYGWGSLFPSPSYMRQRYGLANALPLPLTYPYRWLLGIKGALSVLARLTRDAHLILLAVFH